MSDDLVEIARGSHNGDTYTDETMKEPRLLTHVLADEIIRLRAKLDTARREGMEEVRTIFNDAIENTPLEGTLLMRQIDATMRAAASVSPGEYLTEAEQERDVFFNRLGRITEYLNIPVDATAQRIIEAIQERIDNEREACASVEVRLTVPEGAEAWTPLEAWEEALLAFDEAFRETIRAAAKEVKP